MAKNIYRELERKALSLEKSASYTEDITANEGLNENNVQSCFQYNATTGEYVYVKVDGSIFVDVDSPRVRQQLNSDKICVDMGYSIDGDPRKDWKFTLNGTILIIQTVAMRSDLVRLNLAKNECAVVTNDPNFRTLVWLNYEANGKTLDYEFTTLNSSISSWVGNEIAKKLNKYNPEELNTKITDVENRVTNTETRLDTAENNITVLQSDLTEETAQREEKDTELDTRVTTLENKTTGISKSGADTVIDNLKVSGELSALGNSLFEDVSVKDFNIVGNISGELKDKDGFTWEKVRRGTIQDYRGFKNILIKLNKKNCMITGSYEERFPQDVNNLELYNLMVETPSIVTKIEELQFISTDKNVRFLTSATKNDNTSFYLNYRNMTNTKHNIQGVTFDFLIKCQIDISSQNIIWD